MGIFCWNYNGNVVGMMGIVMQILMGSLMGILMGI